MNFQTLKDMYLINSRSGHEEELQDYIRGYLDNIGVSYQVDKYNQTYSLTSHNTPLVCAHADQVGVKPIKWLNEHNRKIHSYANLGADDKNGVFIVLELLREYPELNFIISNQEEIGGNIQHLLAVEDLSHIPYALVFDRKGKGDIIGADNGYCVQEFEDDIALLGRGFGYKPTMGVWSDCDSICHYMSCVNLSCGYYNAHTDKEYTNMDEVVNAFEFARNILDNITEYYDAPDALTYPTGDYLDYPQYMDDVWQIEDEYEICPCCNINLHGNVTRDYYCDNCGFDLFGQDELTYYGDF